MPKVKVPRKSTAIDMTAMCDVAFLLLTFFILTTKFRAPEAVQIDIPSSTAQIPIPDKNLIQFDIAPDGRVFFSLENQKVRESLINRIAQEYKLDLNAQQIKNFTLTDLWGMDINKLPDFLKKNANERANEQMPGIKVDTSGGDPQLRNLILWSRQEAARDEVELRIAIKADKATDYKTFDKVIQTLQDVKVNRFNLITSAKQGKE